MEYKTNEELIRFIETIMQINNKTLKSLRILKECMDDLNERITKLEGGKDEDERNNGDIISTTLN